MPSSFQRNDCCDAWLCEQGHTRVPTGHLLPTWEQRCLFYGLPVFQHVHVVALSFVKAVLFTLLNDEECCLKMHPPHPFDANGAKQFETDLLKGDLKL